MRTSVSVSKLASLATFALLPAGLLAMGRQQSGASLQPGWEIVLALGWLALAWIAYAAATHDRDVCSDSSFEAVLASLPSGVVVFDHRRRVLHFNQRYLSMYGFNAGEIYPGMREDAVRELRRAKGLPLLGDRPQTARAYTATRGTYTTESWDMPDGRTIRISRLPIAGGGFVAKHDDITAEKRRRAELRQTQAFLKTVVDAVPAAILVKDARSLKYTIINRRAEEVLGLRAETALGKTAREIYGPVDAERVESRDSYALASSGADQIDPEHPYTAPSGERKILRSSRRAVLDGTGAPLYLLSVLEDLTREKENEQQIQYLALHDALTGLFNRTWFHEEFPAAIRNVRPGRQLAIAMIDLDGFKGVNDCFGHAAGDAVLCETGRRLNAWLEPGSCAVRLGGDEFAVLVEGPHNDPDLARRLAALRESIAEPFTFEGQRLTVGASVGYAVTANASADPELVSSQADAALYEAKNHETGVAGYDRDIMKKRLRRKALERHMHEAIAGRAFEVYYQPIVSAGAGQIVSMEALLRWRHPEFGVVSPAEFVPIAEEAGLIVPLGEFVLEEACAAAAAWPDNVSVSVNLSPLQFRDPQLVAHIAGALCETKLPARRLELEITEAALLTSEAANMEVLHAIRKMGARVVMDDFGTGYSSLNYLRKFPFDKIKIDKSYVDGLLEAGDSSDRILHAVFALARELRLDTTAEGVEEASQVDFLQREGCTQLQGYYFAKPMPRAMADAMFIDAVPVLDKVA
ncbi:MAG: putative bifunctional diguanylate cyclase/phosphodiesterase [Beijerinckiaceae bacterium]